MPPFTYQPYQSRYTATLADLMGAPDRAQAQAEIAKGQASAQLWSGIGHETAQTLNALALYKAQEPYRQAEQLRLNQMKLDAQDEQNLRNAYAQAKGDPTQMRQILTGMPGGVSLKSDQLLETLVTKKQQHDNELTSQIGSFIHESGNTPEAMQAAFDASEKAGLMTSDDVQRIASIVNSDPSRIPSLARGMIAATPEGRKRLEDTAPVAPGASLYSKFDNKVLYTAPEKKNFTIEQSQDSSGQPIWRAVEQGAGVEVPGKPLEGEDAYIAAWAKANNRALNNVTDAERLKLTAEYAQAKHVDSTLNALSPARKEGLITTILANPAVYGHLREGTREEIAPDLYARGFTGFDAPTASAIATAERWRQTQRNALNSNTYFALTPDQKQQAIDAIEASYKLQIGRAAAGTPQPVTTPVVPPPVAKPAPGVAAPGSVELRMPDNTTIRFETQAQADAFAKAAGLSPQP